MASKFDVIVIGGGIAGVQAAITTKKVRPTASVAMISHNQMTYPSPNPVAVISGYIKSAKGIKRCGFRDLRDLKIKTFEGCKAEFLKHENRMVQITKKPSKKKFSVEYEKLVISTGSNPVAPSIEGSGLKGVFTVKWFDDALALSRYSAPGMKAFVDGAGFIGLEVAEALARRGLDVTIVVRSRVLRKLLEPDLLRFVTRRIEAHSVKVMTGATIEEVGGERKVEHVLIKGKKYYAEIVVFARGVRPNTSLAARAGLQLAQNGAIKTGNRMQSNLEGVYAAGDCAETLDLITGKSVYRPLGSIGAQAARIAGSNAVGVDKTYNGFMRVQYNRVFGVEIGSIGLTAIEAKNLGLTVDAIDVYLKESKHPVLSVLLPTKALMKAIVRKDTETIVGWQLIASRQNAWKFWAIWSLIQLIQRGRTLSQIQELGFALRKK